MVFGIPSKAQKDAAGKVTVAFTGFAISSDRAVQDRYVATAEAYLPYMHQKDLRKLGKWSVYLVMGEARHVSQATGADRDAMFEGLNRLVATQLSDVVDPDVALMLGGPSLAVKLIRRIADALIDKMRSLEPEPEVQMIPADQLAPFADGPADADIYDPEFREQAPDLARAIDEAVAREGKQQFDLAIVDGAGVGSRGPRYLSATKPELSQRLTDDDVAALRGMTAALASGERPLTDLSTLTYVELTRMLALIDEAGAGSGLTNIDAPAAESLRPVIQMEMDNRPK